MGYVKPRVEGRALACVAGEGLPGEQRMRGVELPSDASTAVTRSNISWSSWRVRSVIRLER